MDKKDEANVAVAETKKEREGSNGRGSKREQPERDYGEERGLKK